MIVLRVFLPFAVAYLVAYLLRVVNAVAGEPLSAELGLSATELGFLTSVYLFGFALTQLPFGVLMDRYGPRKVEAAVLVLAAAGCGLFAVASDFGELVVGRALMGIGASMCLMGPFTAYRRWFSAERLPLVVALHMTFGALGSTIGGGPTAFLLDIVGWRALFAILAGAVLLSSAAILLVVPRRHEERLVTPVGPMIAEVGGILRSRALWRVAPLAATTQAGYLAVVSLWTGPWLREVAGLSPADAALWLSIASSGLIAGFIGFGVLASRIGGGTRGLEIFVSGAALYTIVSLLIIVLPPAAATPLWFLYAAIGTGGILTYAVACAAFPAAMAGRVNTALNFIVFVFSFAVQWAFGFVLDLFPGPDGGVTAFGFRVALSALLALTVVSFVPLLLAGRVPVAAAAR
jgi:predicted MFS family arabinose efflux permease